MFQSSQGSIGILKSIFELFVEKLYIPCCTFLEKILVENTAYGAGIVRVRN